MLVRYTPFPQAERADHLTWRTVSVNGRRTHYGVAGEGLPVLFLHGWALGSHAYKRALKRLVRLGCRVYAPAMPEFGGTDGLPSHGQNLGFYAAWADAFLAALKVDEPVLAIGHSFGGGVAAKLAHDFPERVAHLALINSIGARSYATSAGHQCDLRNRPLWVWAALFPGDIATAAGIRTTLSAVIEDAVPNLLRNPLGFWRAGQVARGADLRRELAAIRVRGVPVTIVWGEGDQVIPRASFEALCAALGVEGQLVAGHHSWLLADPEAFGAAFAPVVASARAARAANTVDPMLERVPPVALAN